jgi:uncharacterized protein YndB with AHSA1/START domain
VIEMTWRSSASREQVWQVLSNGWFYASWVVGASRIREVDSNWPAEGSKIHHSVGVWPLLINDESQIVSSEPNRLLKLLAKTRPLGEALVEIELTDEPDGNGTCIRMREDAVRGPGKAIPRPLRRAALVPRNRESLRRLSYLAEGLAR